MTTINTQVLDSLGLTQQQEQVDNDRLGQSEFLKLMITQLNHQDPLKPMESGEFYTQIAQFSTVAGIQDLQASFQQVATAMYSGQALQASTMVGRSVLVSASAANVPAGGGINGVVDVPVSTSQVGVSIYDQAGQLVRRMTLGDQGAGQSAFAWDGRNTAGDAVAPGVYFIEADILYEGQAVAVETMVSSRVESVTMARDGQGIMLNLSSGDRAALADIKQIM
jgi:flagellar basal-body rod modification protein FlgD